MNLIFFRVQEHRSAVGAGVVDGMVARHQDGRRFEAMAAMRQRNDGQADPLEHERLPHTHFNGERRSSQPPLCEHNA